MAEAVSRIRIFLSSPGDVTAERDVVSTLVEALNLGDAGTRVELVRWEESYYSATSSFQQQIASPADCDLLILILWSRIGTPLPRESYSRPDGSGYRSGTEYEFETAFEAARASGRPDIFVYRKTAPPPLQPGDASGEAQWRDLQAFWSRWFVDGQGHCIAGYHDFPSVDALEHKLATHLRQWLHDRRQLSVSSWPASKGSPFRGLEAFEAEHAPIFFGRRIALRQVRRRLAHAVARGCAFLLIVGRSGVGKSSFVKAGLLPALRRGEDEAPGEAAVAIVRADEGAAGLCASLAAALSLDAARLAAATPEETARLVGGAIGGAGRYGRLVVYLDQFEGLFGLDSASRDGLVALVTALAHWPGIAVIATLRADLYRHLQELPALVALKESGASYDLLPPSADDIRDIIRSPAAAAGLGYEFDAESGSGLDEVLLRAASHPDVLPLLQFTLDELYKRRTPAADGGGQGTLTFAAYRALGGLEGAIASRAEDEFARLDTFAQSALPAVLRACVTAAGAGDDRLIAQSVPLDRFPPGTPERRLIDAFTHPRARLMVVVADGEGPAGSSPNPSPSWPVLSRPSSSASATLSGDPRHEAGDDGVGNDDRSGRSGGAVRLAHEALLTRWPRAVEQLAIDRQLILARARLVEQAARWRAATGPGRDSLLLAPGLPLGEAEAVLDRDGPLLPSEVVGFIRASTAANLGRLERETLTARRQARRARAVTAVIGALGLTTAAAAVVGFQFWREAEHQAGVAQERAELADEQRRAAEHNLALAIDAADGLVSGVADRLRDLVGVRAETIASILAEAEALMRTIEEESVEVPPTLRHRQALMYSSFSDSYLELGDMAKARASAELCRAMLVELVADPAAPNEWRADLVSCMERLGRILLTQDDPAAAVALFREGIEIAGALAGADPANVEWRRRLSSSHMALGDALSTMGDWPGARAALEADRDLTAALLEEHPENVTMARDLAISLNRIGGISRAEGRLAEALASHEEALAVFRHLAAAMPEDARLVSDVALTQSTIGEVLQIQGRLPEAVEAYEESLLLHRELAALDPGNRRWSRSIAVDLKELGLIAMRRGDLAAARVHLGESQDVFERLADSDPQNIQWQRDLLTSLAYQADLLAMSGDADAAGAVLLDRLERARALLVAHPGVADITRDLSYAIDGYAEHLVKQGDLAQARALLQESLANLERLADAQPDNASIANDLSYTWQDLATVEMALGNGDAAVAALGQAIGIATALSARSPDNADLARGLSVIYSDLGYVHYQLGDYAASGEAYRQDYAIASRLAEMAPDNLDWQRDLALSHASLADVAQAQQDFETAEHHFRESIAVVERLVAASPGPTPWQRDLLFAHLRLGFLLAFDSRFAAAQTSIADAAAIAEERAALLADQQQAAADLELVRSSMLEVERMAAAAGVTLTELPL